MSGTGVKVRQTRGREMGFGCLCIESVIRVRGGEAKADRLVRVANLTHASIEEQEY